MRARLGIRLLLVVLPDDCWFAPLLGFAGIIELMKKLLLREFDADACILPDKLEFKY